MALKQRLAESGLTEITLIQKSETLSTSTDCRELIDRDSPDTPVLIIADTQTGGRGRQGKTFSSPKGGLYMSLALRWNMDFSHTLRITSAAAVAVCRAILRVCGVGCGIKWVNDIYRNGRKLCGILTEAVNDYGSGTTRYLIIGIGINLTDHPHGINATDLFAETGRQTDRDLLCAAVTKELFTVLGQIKEGDFSYMEEYRRLSCVIGREISLSRNGCESHGTAIGIDDDGGLTVQYPDGVTETLSSGEITLRVRD